MPDMYVDRGLIKWSAFDALVGYHSMLEEMRYRLGKKPRPSLSEDDYEELNRKLVFALQENKEVEIRYYHDGYIRFTFGFIRRVDYDKRQIIISTSESFNAEDIIKINLV